MNKLILAAAIALSTIPLMACSGKRTEQAIQMEMYQKCRDGNMKYIDSYECSNLIIDKYVSIADEEFKRIKPIVMNCAGEENTEKLIKINSKSIKIIEKTRPSLWSKFVPFVSPKNSVLARQEDMEKSDDWNENEKARRTLVENLQGNQLECLISRGVKSLNLVTRTFN